jgi:hypothetical protein
MGPVRDSIGLAGMQRHSALEGFTTRDADARGLVKLRAEDEAVQLPDAHAPLPCRPRLGHLSIAQNERLELLDCVRLEKRVDQRVQDSKFPQVDALALTKRHCSQCVLQQAPPPPRAAPY